MLPGVIKRKVWYDFIMNDQAFRVSLTEVVTEIALM